MGIGDHVKLLDAEDQKFTAVFLGMGKQRPDRTQTEEPLFWFQFDDHRLMAFTESELRIHGRSGEPQIGSDEVEPLLYIMQQKGPTCTAHSTLNCMRFLNEFAVIENKDAKLVLDTPQGLKMIFGQLVKHMGPKKVSFLQALFGAVETQDVMRTVFLDRFGFGYEITDNFSAVKRALLSGKPVILDLNEDATRKIFTRKTEIHIPSEKRRIVHETKTTESAGHSVLAIALVKDDLLVLDSATGFFLLIDAESVKTGITRSRTGIGSATIVWVKH